MPLKNFCLIHKSFTVLMCLPPKLSLGSSAAWAKLDVSSSLNHTLWVPCFAALSGSAKSNVQLKTGYEGNEVILNCLQTSRDSVLVLKLTWLLALRSGYSLPDRARQP